MAHQGGHVDGGAVALHCVQVLRKSLEGPVRPQTTPQGLDAHPLDFLQRLHDQFAVLAAGGGDGEAAVAHHHRRHPMPGGDAEHAVPHQLGVVMGVNVHEARRHHHPVRLDGLGSLSQPWAHFRDFPGANADFALEAGLPRAVHHGAAGNLDVEIHVSPRVGLELSKEGWFTPQAPLLVLPDNRAGREVPVSFPGRVSPIGGRGFQMASRYNSATLSCSTRVFSSSVRQAMWVRITSWE